MIAHTRDDLDTARQQLETIVEDTPDSPLARAIVDQTVMLARRAFDLAKPYRFNVSTAGGFNDNVIALGNSVLLPSDLSGQEAGFSTSSLSASYTWQVQSSSSITAGYRFLANVYGGLSGFDLLDHFNYVDVRHNLRQDLAGTLRVSNQFTQVGGSNFRNQVGVRPAFVWWPTSWGIFEGAYSYFNGDYYFPTTTVFDRDGHSHTIALTSFLRIPGLPIQGRIGYFHLWNQTDGADFDFQSNGVLVGVTASLLSQLTAEMFYSRSFNRYDNANSLAGPTGFAFKRMDDVDRVTAQFSWAFFRVDQSLCSV